jgi:hypothetical protein
LFAANRAQLLSMIRDVRHELAKHGLNLNMDKCLIQTNMPGVTVAPIKVDGTEIPMVCASKGFKILGTQYTLVGRCSAEIRARIKMAWGKFHQLWPLLGKRDGNLNKRLRLFDASVTQTVLWCCESWLITQAEKRLLKTTLHGMLRRIAGPRRRPLEDWLDWMKRSTRQAVGAARKHGIRLWHEAHLRAKWNWAGHVVRMSADRLARRAVEWRDSSWQATEMLVSESLRIRRPARTHWFRWEDELRRYAAHSALQPWQTVAKQKEEWAENLKAFVEYTRK